MNKPKLFAYLHHLDVKCCWWFIHFIASRKTNQNSLTIEKDMLNLHEVWPLGKLLYPSFIYFSFPWQTTSPIILSNTCTCQWQMEWKAGNDRYNESRTILSLLKSNGSNFQEASFHKWIQSGCYVYRQEMTWKHTAFPSGKQRQKKFGLGLPTASLIESVITPVTRTENRRPKCMLKHFNK